MHRLPRPFARRASRRPAGPIRHLIDGCSGGATAYIEGLSWRSISWDEVGAVADGWYARRRALGGSRTRRRVGLAVSDPVSMSASTLGALAAGVTVVPLDPGASADDLVAQRGLFGLSTIVTDLDDAALLSRLAAGGADIWRPAADGQHQLMNRRGRPASPAVGDAAIIMPCGADPAASPTTISLTEADILRMATAVVNDHGLGADDRGYSPLPLFQTDGLVTGVMATLVSGGTLIVERQFSSPRFWPTVQRHGATWVNLASAMVTVLEAEAPPGPALPSGIGVEGTTATCGQAGTN